MMQHAEDRYLRDAHKARDKDTQRRALVRILELCHSDSVESKKFAASSFKNYITLFPDMEDDMINAIYDLCEDQSSVVRIQGYQAIAAVSKQDSKWVKRNADVLVQLLQSDEPDEIFYVRKGLDEHLDLAPSITIGVLCDQIVSPEEPMDEEDQFTRDRLRALVLGFLCERIKKIVSITKDEPGSEPEKVLVSGVLKAIPRSTISDINMIVKDIILCLPSYKYRSPPGETVLEAVLNEAKDILSEELPRSQDLERTRAYLELAGLITGTASRVLPLLEFYFNFVVDSLTSLTTDTQSFVIESIAAQLETYSEIDRSKDATEARRLVTDSDLLKILSDSGISDAKACKACRTLLKACTERQKHSPSWTPSSRLADTLQRIQEDAQSQQEKMDVDYLQDVQELTRSLLQTGPVKTDTTSGDSGSAASSRRQKKRKHDPDLDRPNSRQETPPSGSRRGRVERSLSSNDGLSDRTRSPKRTKKDEGENGQPSLLSRLNPANDSPRNMDFQPPRRSDPVTGRPIQLPPSLPKKPDVPMPAPEREEEVKRSSSGLSIKGAATRSAEDNDNGRGRRGSTPSRPKSRFSEAPGESLLERLNDDDRNHRRKGNRKRQW